MEQEGSGCSLYMYILYWCAYVYNIFARLAILPEYCGKAGFHAIILG